MIFIKWTYLQDYKSQQKIALNASLCINFRGLHLEEKVKPIEDEINRLEMEKNDLEISKRSNKMCIKQMEKESAELRQNIEEMEECLLTDGGCGESEEVTIICTCMKEF